MKLLNKDKQRIINPNNIKVRDCLSDYRLHSKKSLTMGDKLIIIFGIIVVIGFIVAGIYYNVKTNKVEKSHINKYGIADKFYNWRRGRPLLVILYEVNGKTYNAQYRIKSQDPVELGDSVEIIYCPEEPSLHDYIYDNNGFLKRKPRQIIYELDLDEPKIDSIRDSTYLKYKKSRTGNVSD